MKKLFALATIFTLVLAACPTDGGKGDKDNSDKDNSDVIGIWAGNYSSGTYTGVLTLDIADGTWVMVFSDGSGPTSYNGKWTRKANTLKISDKATAQLSEGKLFLTQNINTDFIHPSSYGRRPSTITLTKKVVTPPVVTTLKINNQSFTEITDVTWNNVSFAETQYVNSIRSGNNVTNNVQAGGSYIFFKRKSNPITARTKDIIIVETGKSIEFVFNDNTVIIEVNNTTNTGTLGALQNTVVWFDDAEGEMQPYYLRQNFAGYYSTVADLSNLNTSYFYSPKNGKKSIAIGSSATSLLHLKITLAKKAKLSFWYANRGTASLLINDDTKFNSNQNIAWSFIEFDLEQGVNDLIWKNTSTATTTTALYFFLDDILIYYTE